MIPLGGGRAYLLAVGRICLSLKNNGTSSVLVLSLSLVMSKISLSLENCSRIEDIRKGDKLLVTGRKGITNETYHENKQS